jgi:hypothetical protein
MLLPNEGKKGYGSYCLFFIPRTWPSVVNSRFSSLLDNLRHSFGGYLEVDASGIQG